MTAGSWPKICTAQGLSSGRRWSRALVFSSRYTRALAETISEVLSAAPSRRQRARKAKSVTPAMGASTARPFNSMFPIRTMLSSKLKTQDSKLSSKPTGQ